MTRSVRLATRLAFLPKTLAALEQQYGPWVHDLPDMGVPEQSLAFVAKALNYHIGGKRPTKSVGSEALVRKLTNHVETYHQNKSNPDFRTIVRESHPDRKPKDVTQFGWQEMQHLNELWTKLRKEYAKEVWAPWAHASGFPVYGEPFVEMLASGDTDQFKRWLTENYPTAPIPQLMTFDQWRREKAKEQAKQQKNRKQYGDIVTTFGDIDVFRATTTAQACNLGKGTGWCTRGTDMAQSYLDEGPLYVWKTKDNEPIAQLAYKNTGYETIEFKTPDNRDVDDDELWKQAYQVLRMDTETPEEDLEEAFIDADPRPTRAKYPSYQPDDEEPDDEW